ncbi:MAG: hypothetical protein ACRDEA_20935 [Microcystaceae cyanobacterium]
MAIPFTDREVEKAWRENKSASDKTPRSNAHRLLLFYAVECGLKAILMRRQGKNRSDLCTDLYECQHDVNKLLDCLSVDKDLSQKLRKKQIYLQRYADLGIYVNNMNMLRKGEGKIY